MSRLTLKLDLADENNTKQFANVTSNGAFEVGNVLKINESGYVLKSESYHDRVHSSDASLSSSTPPDSRVSSIVDACAPSGGFEITSLAELQPLHAIGQGASGLVQKCKFIKHADLSQANTGSSTDSSPSPSTASIPQFFALKNVPLDLSESKAKQVLIELRTLHHSHHPNIVDFYGAFYKEQSISLVLEYMEWGSLSDILKKRLSSQCKRISSESYISCISRHVLQGLQYLHEVRRIIHRDIKLSNILINAKGQCKLADFGVSGECDGESMSNKVSFVGTVTYMSPERIQGLPHSFDSDLWSLGLTIMECALGIFPYAPEERDKDEEMQEKKQSSPIKNNIPRASRSRKSINKSEAEQQQEKSLSISVATSSNIHSNDSTCSSNTSTPSHASYHSPSHAALNNSVLYSPSSSLAPPLSPATSSASPSPSTSPRDQRSRSQSLSVHPNTDFYNSTQTVAPSPSQLLRPHATQGGGSTSVGSAHSSGSKSKKKSRFGFWDIMEKIVQSTPPTLTAYQDRVINGRAVHFSDEFQDFIARLLQKEPKNRPTARQMLAHPFITKYLDVNLLDWLNSFPPLPPSSSASATNLSALVPSSLPIISFSLPAVTGSSSNSTHSVANSSAISTHKLQPAHSPTSTHLANLTAQAHIDTVSTCTDDESEIECIPVHPTGSFQSIDVIEQVTSTEAERATTTDAISPANSTQRIKRKIDVNAEVHRQDLAPLYPPAAYHPTCTSSNDPPSTSSTPPCAMPAYSMSADGFKRQRSDPSMSDATDTPTMQTDLSPAKILPLSSPSSSPSAASSFKAAFQFHSQARLQSLAQSMSQSPSRSSSTSPFLAPAASPADLPPLPLSHHLSPSLLPTSRPSILTTPTHQQLRSHDHDEHMQDPPSNNPFHSQHPVLLSPFTPIGSSQLTHFSLLKGDSYTQSKPPNHQHSSTADSNSKATDHNK